MTKSQLRKLLEAHELPQTVAARELGIDPRTMRRYIAGAKTKGGLPVPKVVEYALRWLILQRKGGTKS
jgi:hypothetical protein